MIKMSFVAYIQKFRQCIQFSSLTFITIVALITSLTAMAYIIYVSNIAHATNFATAVLDDKINVSASFMKKTENLNTFATCNFLNCFNVYRCGNKGNQLLVYVYPQKSHSYSTAETENNSMTEEFHTILETIIASKYYTSNPNEACIFIPSIDFLNPDRKNIHVSEKLKLLQYWERGTNHLIFNVMHGNINSNNDILDKTAGQAMIAGIGFTKINYRIKFDVSLPILSTSLKNFHLQNNNSRKWLIASSQINIDPDIEKDLSEIKRKFPEDLNILNLCSYNTNKTNLLHRCANQINLKYPEILQRTLFCLILRGEKFGLSIILEALATGCIPVIVFDSLVMPFDEVIDWSRSAVFIRESDILLTVTQLRKISVQRIKELQNHGKWLYKKYFRSIKTITEMTLHIIANRIFPHFTRNYHFWNEPDYLEISSPVFLPLTIPKNDGFTAIILTYDRIDLLFLLIHKLSKVPSLSKILIVWNNNYKKPPHLSKWPKVYKMIKIIETENNVLSNRFYPFDEIETEAVLSIDDDIIMLTEDEIEFAFEVWREFPDRLVGFPSRTHGWNNKTLCWKYESEWTNHISMVLTGAAFYHKYWNYAYTAQLPEDIKEWVDNHMNCEDIAMNFLVSNITRKAPIKVTAKKKFRCPECVNTEMLSADLTHMLERTQCINQFTKIFGRMPLLSVEFRADPVLFKDNFPDKLKRYRDVGSL